MLPLLCSALFAQGHNRIQYKSTVGWLVVVGTVANTFLMPMPMPMTLKRVQIDRRQSRRHQAVETSHLNRQRLSTLTSPICCYEIKHECYYCRLSSLEYISYVFDAKLNNKRRNVAHPQHTNWN